MSPPKATAFFHKPRRFWSRHKIADPKVNESGPFFLTLKGLEPVGCKNRIVSTGLS